MAAGDKPYGVTIGINGAAITPDSGAIRSNGAAIGIIIMR
jgi:hypothetical protein